MTLTEDTTVKGMTIYNLNAGALFISQAQADIILPAGTDLPVALNIVVPVDQKISVKLLVDVDIPLNQTDLHPPFVGLQDVVKPYYTLLGDLPDFMAGGGLRSSDQNFVRAAQPVAEKRLSEISA